MRLIGINGFKGSGKDTTFRIIQDMYKDGTVHRVAFADSLKVAAAAAIGYDGTNEERILVMDDCKNNWDFRATFNDPPYEQFKKFSGRRYLQWFGQGMREVFGDSFWVDQILPSDKKAFADKYRKTRVLCVTDVRYPNEAERIKELGGEIWEVIRPGLVSDGHSSEIPLPVDLVDRTLINNGTINDLEVKVREVYVSTRGATSFTYVFSDKLLV